MWRSILPSMLALAALGCGNETPSRATVIDPVFGDPCRFETCSEHGLCTPGDDDGPRCACEVGYAGTDCSRCDAGFHTDSKGRCAPDRTCAEQTLNPCGDYGSCKDETGVIECHCDPGYEGPRCTLCKVGYGRGKGGECLALVLGGGTGDSGGQGGPEPSETCGPDSCSGHGDCDDSNGKVTCACDRGYAGASCASCASRFHEEGGACVLDTTCLPRSCPDTATCVAGQGKVECRCKKGYTGVDCDQCATGYVRDFARGTCTTFECEGNPIPGTGVLDFEGKATFPTFDNNCISRVAVDTDEVMITSLAGDGEVWACATNTVYGVPTSHIFVEAGVENSSELIFSGPVAQISFDYGARTELALEVIGDGQVRDALSAVRRTHGSASYTFDPPITLFALRSTNGSTQQVALDNIVYTPPECP